MDQTSKSPAPRRRWLRYGLRTLLISLTVLCVGLGYVANRIWRQRSAVEAIAAVNGAVRYDYQENGTGKPAGPARLRRLTGDELFQQVVQVTLRSTRADDALVAQLTNLPEIEKLDVGGTRITNAGVKAIGQLKRLKSLDLGFNAIGRDGLAGLEGLSNLEHLDLTTTQVTDEDLAVLVGLRRLSSLVLDNTRIGDRGMEILAKCSALSELDLADTLVTDEGLRHLTALTGLTRLRLNDRETNLSVKPRITNRGIEYLGELKKLRELALVNQKITNKGLRNLSQLQSLQNLNVSSLHAEYSLLGLSELQDSLPETMVYWSSQGNREDRSFSTRQLRMRAERVAALRQALAAATAAKGKGAAPATGPPVHNWRQ